MNLYMHYKNKPYKYLGIVRHSETQEDLALYECRYPNESSKIWVRPRDMFFENTIVNGVSTRRFRPIPLEIENKTELSAQDLEGLSQLAKEALGNLPLEDLQKKLQNAKKSHIQIAKVEGKPVGFKIAIANDENSATSWVGGVLPEYRGVGIAHDLMNAQHAWAKAQGFSKIQTKTMNKFKDMLILNLKHGFEVVGTETDEKFGFQIVLEKKLTQN